MEVQFFGEFLVDRWMITQTQLHEGLQLQNYRNIKFGQLAVERKQLTWDQVERIHDIQRVRDVYFADLAVCERLLTAYEARQILMLQRASHLYLGEALLELGYLSEDILDRELAIYHEENQQIFPDELCVSRMGIWRDMIHTGVDLTKKFLIRLTGPAVKVGKGVCMTRDTKAVEENKEFFSVVVGLRGDLVANYVLSLPWSEAREVASKFLKQDINDMTKAKVEEATKNICALACDHMARELKNNGANIMTESPILLPTPPRSSEGTETICFPIRLSHSVLDLRFMVYRA